MSVWLTPDLKPFYGGTYFPPESKWGRPGFVDILQEIGRVWKAERGKVVESAEALTARLRSMEQAAPSADVPGVAALEKTVQQFRDAFDSRHGGFGDAPKFPRPSELLFLLREHARAGAPKAAEMVLRTLRAMALGGMRDHVGGGFHRYSVDGGWRVPHFEKMLYDQGQLLRVYAEAWRRSGAADDDLLWPVRETAAWLRREMSAEDGGFFASLDADSEGEEGIFYVWTPRQVEAALGAEAGAGFCLAYGVTERGNFEHAASVLADAARAPR